jgi:Predicted GTPase, probable translation factor
MSEAQKKGLVKLVDKNYIIEDGSIIEIRFNV